VPSPPPNFADRDYFNRLRERDEAAIVGERVHSRVLEGDVLNIARRRSTADGVFDGVLQINVRPEQAFLSFWRSAAPPGTVEALVRTDGLYLARLPHPGTDLTQSLLHSWAIQATAAGPHFANAASPTDGISRLYAVRAVEGFPAVVVHGVTEDEILRPWRSRTMRDAVLFGTTGLCLGSLAFAVAYQIRRADRLVGDLQTEARKRDRA